MEYRVLVRVVSQKGKCVAEHKVGDKVEIAGPLTERGRLCNSALAAMYPQIMAMRFGADLPWAKKGKVLVACPDAENPVVFEISRKKPR